ncbi:MAG: sigma-70 family RNA polymerase sigma factor [Puniceicoccales bacterium]|nr:sigma-70 family RNA polymerase sigma factor [Puniceicoccales bacterium]
MGFFVRKFHFADYQVFSLRTDVSHLKSLCHGNSNSPATNKNDTFPNATHGDNADSISKNIPPEDPLITDIKNGSKAALAQFIDNHKQRVFSVVYNIVHNPDDASDITQDVFIKAYHAIHTFKSNASTFTWLYRIAVNLSLSFLRKHKSRHFVSIDQLDESNISPEQLRSIPTFEGGDQTAKLKELQKKLNESLQMLSNKHRVVFVLFEIEGLSQEEIAQVMKCSVGTVRSRLHYAKQQLQVYLKEFL